LSELFQNHPQSTRPFNDSYSPYESANAQYFNGPDSIIGILAGAMAKKFKKVTMHLPARYGTWLQKVDSLFARLNKLVANPPKILEQEFGHNEFEMPPSKTELANLGKAIGMLKCRNDMAQFIQLLTALSVPFLIDGDELRIQTQEISQFAAKPLIAFTKEKLSDMGLKYPT
jgi:hypothetical protein